MTEERFQNAAKYFKRALPHYPNPEAAHALDCHFVMLRALEAVDKSLDHNDGLGGLRLLVNDAIAKAKEMK